MYLKSLAKIQQKNGKNVDIPTEKQHIYSEILTLIIPHNGVTRYISTVYAILPPLILNLLPYFFQSFSLQKYFHSGAACSACMISPCSNRLRTSSLSSTCTWISSVRS